MKIKFCWIICFILLTLVPLDPKAAFAKECQVSGPRYRLADDAVNWSIKIENGQSCIRGLRFRNVSIENFRLVAPPQSGQVTLLGSGFSYTAKLGFRGQDSFALALTGTIDQVPGNSTIRITVSVIGAPSAADAPAILAASEPCSRRAENATSSATNSVLYNTLPSDTNVTRSSACSEGKWAPLKIGAGGFITGINIASDGTKVVRTDTYGAYVWDVETARWRQVLTTQSMPVLDVVRDAGKGVYEIAIAPSQTSRLYMLFNGYVYRSDNSGHKWSRTGFRQVSGIDPNASTKLFGRYMAVDPANPDIVYVGTPSNGLWTTDNGGASWSRVGGIAPASSSGLTQGGGHLIAFDPSSIALGGKTQGIYVTSYGTGVYHSSDGGAGWQLTAGTPTTHQHLFVDQKGKVYLTDNSNGTNNVSMWNGKSWSQFPIGNRGHSIAVDPVNTSRIVIGIDSGDLIISTNGGADWAGPTFTHATKTAVDVPWLGWTNETYMSNGDMAFDPSGKNVLYFANGIGVWHCTPPSSNATVPWISQNAGIEQLVGNLVVAPPAGKPIALAWDRPVFYINDPSTYPSTHGPDNAHAIIMGWSADWASTSPATIVGILNWWGTDVSGVSKDGGQTWTPFAALPGQVPEKIAGGIAAASPTNFVWVPSNNANPWFTTDGGASWLEIGIPGVPSSGETGWGFAYYLDRQIVAADRGRADTFYLYNYGPSNRPAAAGLYRSTDKGATWTHIFSGEISPLSGFNTLLKSVPGQAGHLFFSSGPQSGAKPPANTPFMRSTDGGVTWVPVGDFKEVHSFGFGAAYPGQSYPTIFAAGYNNGLWGIWQSLDDASSWTMIGDFPLGSFDQIKSVEGDKDRFGTVYIAFGGSGFAYRTND